MAPSLSRQDVPYRLRRIDAEGCLEAADLLAKLVPATNLQNVGLSEPGQGPGPVHAGPAPLYFTAPFGADGRW